MNIKEIADAFDKKQKTGFQLTKRKGVLTSTWVIFKRKELYYFFDINEKFTFDRNHRYCYEELLKEFENCFFEIDTDVY